MSGDAGGTGGQTGSGTGGGSPGSGGASSGSGGASTGTGGAGGASTGTGGAGGSKDGGPDTVSPVDANADLGGLGCDAIEMMYTAALKAAQSCNPRATDQCQKSAPGSLTPCTISCLVPINDDTEVAKLKQAWLQAHCDSQKTPIVCPAIACLPPQGACIPAANDGAASCQNARFPAATQ